MKNLTYFNILNERIQQLKKKKYKDRFSVPGLWLEKEAVEIEIKPFDFFSNRIERIKDLSAEKVSHKEPNVYNMLVRLTAAYDHNSDGNLEFNSGRIRKTGTFLKAIALLPYIHSLGVNTIYLLPVTAIGEDAKKGNLGSPYAIRNPYKPDENLSEPMLELDVETEFKAFSEAVHLLGMKLVCEFVFRTASIDSDLSLEHPEWFYWINSKTKNREAGESQESRYGSPIFLKRELDLIKQKVEDGDFENLPAPHEQFKKMFTEVPKKVARVEGKIRGLLADKKTEVRIPGAFADWPPDDNQPAWTDVTFLRMYDSSKFNYIAYNTIRMYDKNLAKPELKIIELWEYISDIIPHYIDNYDIDGVMIDMGHALPSDLRREIVNRAIRKRNDFFFWEENFSLSVKSVLDGYSAVLGYLPFDAHKPDKLRSLIERFDKKDIPVNFFATSETHNTPRSFYRVTNPDYLKAIYAFNLFLPAISYIHSGFELAESNPVNTGLDFTTEEIERFTTDKLGLFSSVALNWNNEQNIVGFIQRLRLLKNEILFEADDINTCEIHSVMVDIPEIIGFIRREKSIRREILFISNFSEKAIDECFIDVYAGISCLRNSVSGDIIMTENGKFNISFMPYEFYIFEFMMI
ncbi:MAG: alpha-amylase [Candidatus Kapabacteria bacterium]|nr:alpha-amylase [Ignavibacteriota bacterium]MCW5883767.1 alpha-amylase [Candidatus Kapabacteria bacterium]